MATGPIAWNPRCTSTTDPSERAAAPLVAEELYEHPAVAEAGVIDVGHDLLNEEGGAAIVRKRGATATASEISGLVKKRIAAYKYPRQVWFVDELPKDTTGKILRRKVRAPRTETASS